MIPYKCIARVGAAIDHVEGRHRHLKGSLVARKLGKVLVQKHALLVVSFILTQLGLQDDVDVIDGLHHSFSVVPPLVSVSRNS